MRTLGLLCVLAAGCGNDASDLDSPDAGPGVDAGADPRFDEPRGRFVVRESRSVFDGEISRVARVDGAVLADEPTSFHTEIDRVGACRYLAYEPGFCDGVCDGICVDGQCVPFPERTSIGAVRIEGLAPGDLALAEPVEGYYQADGQLPEDLFDAGSAVRLSAGDLSITAAGPAALEDGPDGERLVLADGADAEVSWTPGGRGDRARLVLRTPNQGHGLPFDAIIECDGPDTGRFVIPREWVEMFPAGDGSRICVGHDCPPSELWRYRVGSRDDIELVIASERSFIVARAASSR